jgi:hypothetical protein
MRPLVAALVCALAVTATAQTRDGAAERQLVRREATVVRDVPAGYGHGVLLTTGPRGNVRVAAWRERSIRIEAHLEVSAPSEAEVETLVGVIDSSIDPTPTRVEVSTRGPHDKQWMKRVKNFPKALLTMPWRVDYVVRVPEYTSVTLLVNDGETVVEGIAGIVSVTSARGPVRLANVSGSTRVSAAAGDVEVSTAERSWRGGNLSVEASGALVVRLPQNFSAELDATAPGGITIGGEAVGSKFHGKLGVGGGGLTLTSGLRVEVVLE